MGIGEIELVILYFKEEIMKIFMVAFMVCFCGTITAEAAKPRYYSKPTVKSEVYVNNHNSGGDQERCQAEADHMAANNISGHVCGAVLEVLKALAMAPVPIVILVLQVIA